MAIHLGRLSPDASSNQPERRRGNAPERRCAHGRSGALAAPIRSCSWRGLPCRACRQTRGALLPHRFTLAARPLARRGGGLLSVALSLGSPPPDVIRRHISMEPGLSSVRPASGGIAVRPLAAAIRPTGFSKIRDVSPPASSQSLRGGGKSCGERLFAAPQVSRKQRALVLAAVWRGEERRRHVLLEAVAPAGGLSQSRWSRERKSAGVPAAGSGGQVP
jgi:hypothetical protein